MNDPQIINQTTNQTTNQIITQPLGASGSSVTYQAGNPEFEGQTTVRIESQGKVLVQFQQGANCQSYTKIAEPERFQTIKALLENNNPLKIKIPTSSPVPGETKIRFQITTTDLTQTAEFWSHSIEHNGSLRLLVKLFENLAGETSNGRISY
jgi:hypothetical protein